MWYSHYASKEFCGDTENTDHLFFQRMHFAAFWEGVTERLQGL